MYFEVMYSLEEKITEAKKTEALASIVKRLGSPVSVALLLSSCRVFQIPEIDGLIGYKQIGNCAIVIGEPVCLPEDIAKLTQAFHLHCQESHLKIVYFLVYQEFAFWAINNGFHTLIQVGTELSINPMHFEIRQKLRWKINQSIQEGVIVQEYKDHDPMLENQMKGAIHTWLKERKGPQIHLGDNNFFNSSAENRIFYARQNDKLVGLLTMAPIDRFQGWVLTSYLAIVEAPIGTTEHLMCSAFETLANEDCQFLCLGAMCGKLGEIIGWNSITKSLANLVFRIIRWIFKLDAKAIYLNKFHPQQRPTFVVSKDKLTLNELLAIKKVLNVKL